MGSLNADSKLGSCSRTGQLTALAPLLGAGLGAAIFLIDTATSLDIAIAVLYVVVVLLVAPVIHRTELILVGTGCIGLTALSFLISHAGTYSLSTLGRCLISILAIGITTLLAVTRKQSEEALVHAQADLAHVTRVATLSELAASIAHEVNQPLAGIVTNAEAAMRWMRRDRPDLDETERALARIIGDGKRAAEVIRRLRTLARKGAPQLAVVDLNEVVEDSLPLIERELVMRCVTRNLRLSPTLPRVVGDRVQLQQVIINLVVNGAQAMAETIGKPRGLTISSWVDPTGDAVVAVSDTGPGIDPASRDRIFEAFFTTKEVGMGMGLSICRSIIEAHGGRIWAEAADSAGTVFKVALPAHRRVRW